METTSIIQIRNQGPIVYSEVPLLPDGGVVVLRGHNGCGKSKALEGVKVAVSGNGRLDRRDDADTAEIVIGDSTTRCAKRQTRSGGELGILHVEDDYSIGDIVSPSAKGDEERDAIRIKALVQLSGVTIPWERFQSLVPEIDGARPSIEDAKVLPDPVAQAAKVKRVLDAEARRIERLAKDARTEQDRAMAAAGDADETIDYDLAQSELRAAVTQKAKIDERVEAAAKCKEQRELAELRLDKVLRGYTGQTVSAAQSALQEQLLVVGSQQQVVTDLEKALAAAREALAADKAELTTKQAAVQTATAHEAVVAELQNTLNTSLPDAPDPEEVETVDLALSEAEERMTVATQSRAALAKLEEAKRHGDKALKLEKQADSLRQAGKAADELLSQAVAFEGLRVLGGRLLIDRGDARGEELFDRLSDGERYATGFKIGAERVGDAKGDGTRLLILPQTAWQDLDPDNRDMVNDLAITYGITVLTGQCDRGPLRVVVYGEPDTWNPEVAA